MPFCDKAKVIRSEKNVNKKRFTQAHQIEIVGKVNIQPSRIDFILQKCSFALKQLLSMLNRISLYIFRNIIKKNYLVY